MSDLSIMSQAQMAYSDARSKPQLNQVTKAEDDKSFASLTAIQMRDPSMTDATQRRKIKETAVEFEAQFLSQMLQPMFEGIQAEEPFSGGHSEEMWRSMLVQEYGKSIAKAGGIGLADHVERQLLRAQEGL